MNSPQQPSPEEVRKRLEEFRARRGYLLSHQGAMAAALPQLQDSYGAIYKALTLDQHHLEPLEKEFVWLAILTAAGEHVGTHHIKLFFDHGGTERQAEAVFRLVAWSSGAGTFEFLDRHWQQYFPAVNARRAYLEGEVSLLREFGEVPSSLARLALLGTYTARAAHWGLVAEIEACYAEGVPEVKMAEAISLALWPCGMNRFIEACDVWLGLMRTGRVQPSEPFRVWAETPDQEGFILPPRTIG